MAALLNPTEPKVIIEQVSWQTYERLLADLADRNAPRLTYYRQLGSMAACSAAALLLTQLLTTYEHNAASPGNFYCTLPDNTPQVQVSLQRAR